MSQSTPARKFSILIADDDADDRELIKAAFEENNFRHNIKFVENGEELLKYLKRKGNYADELTHPLPQIILLDLNMPKKDGREVLKEIKQHPELKKIPVIIFTTTKNEHEIKRCYELGANTYIVKPVSFDALVRVIQEIRGYWFNTASIPA